MKITVLMHDDLLPANHGYRVDVYRRLRFLKSRSIQVQLISLGRAHGVDTIESFDQDFADQAFAAGRQAQVGNLQALLGVSRFPWPAACRQLTAERLATIQQKVKAFAPDAYVLEGLYAGPLLFKLLAAHRAKFFYRSHNIEYLYMRDQLRAERGLKQMVNLWLSNLHLKRLEQRVFRLATWVYDISYEDANVWREDGFSNVSWMPPLSSGVGQVLQTAAKPKWDITYLGNLNAPNNVEAIRWMLTEVLPILLKAKPDLAVLISGSSPSESVIQLCGRFAQVELIANPDVVEPIYQETKVLVNPALRGSGVNIKTVDMIASGLQIVVSDAGARGLSPAIQAEIAVAPDPQLFAEKIMAALSRERGMESENAFDLSGTYAKAFEHMMSLTR